MTKSELAQLVRFVYAAFNKDLLPSEEKHIFGVWYELFQDLLYFEVKRVTTTLCTLQKYMPTAGAIKVASIKAIQENPPPTSQQMWAYLQELIRAKNSGVVDRSSAMALDGLAKIGAHQCVRETIDELGGTAYTMNTNGDRTFVLDAYERRVGAYLLRETTLETALRSTVVERNAESDQKDHAEC